jgi:predicted Zn finger-like uncharacterized protein
MSVLRAECPSCDAKLAVKNLALAGRAVKCPKCGGQVVLPRPQPGFEVVEEAEPPEPPKPKAGKKVVAVADDGEDDRPRKKKAKKGGKPAAGGTSMTRTLIGVGLLLVVGTVAAVVWINRSKDKDTADNKPAPADPQPGEKVRPGPGPKGPDDPEPKAPVPGPKPTYDVAKLGYDPTKPDLTIAAIDWPRRSSREDTSLNAYKGKVIATEGRIYGLGISEPSAKGGEPQGPAQVHFYLYDAGGKIFGADGRGVAVSTYLADGSGWKAFRPGQMVRVVGRVRTSDMDATSVVLRDAVVLSIAGPGDPPVTTEELVEAVRKEPKTYAGGFTSDRYVTLTAVVSSIPVLPEERTPEVLLAYPAVAVRCKINNPDAFKANPPKPGDTITIIGKVSVVRDPQKEMELRGVYLAP